MFPALLSKTGYLSAAVGGVRPAMMFPMLSDIGESHFRKNSITQIDSMVPILGRCKDKFRLRGVTGVQIQRTLLIV